MPFHLCLGLQSGYFRKESLLLLSWSRQSSTLELGGSQCGGLGEGRDLQCLETVYQRYKTQLLNPDNSTNHSFTLLQQLHMGLQQHTDLKKVFWKASGVVHPVSQTRFMTLSHGS
jgi:hypothetical protein